MAADMAEATAAAAADTAAATWAAEALDVAHAPSSSRLWVWAWVWGPVAGSLGRASRLLSSFRDGGGSAVSSR